MSKIPQGKWNAIAARYQSGESISEIARSYGCTPPAIHYILKRNRQKPTELAEQPQAIRPAETKQTQLVCMNAPDPITAAAQFGDKDNDQPAGSASVSSAGDTQLSLANTSTRTENVPTGPALAHAKSPGPTTTNPPKRLSNGVLRMPQLRSSSVEPTKSPQFLDRRIGDAVPPTPTLPDVKRPDVASVSSHHHGVSAAPELDSDLHMRAEAAIVLFRSSFDAALAEGSIEVRKRLRQAATDMMRVAAQTTMVLDRLNASNERSVRTHNYPRSALAGEDIK
jgi:hypothetical protein